MKLSMLIITTALLVVLSGCKPDKVVLELYTSDIHKAGTEGVVDVQLTAIFEHMGKDEDGSLLKASDVAKRYLDEKADIKIFEGKDGDVMVVKSTVPMGTEEALKTYLVNTPRPYALTIKNTVVILGATQHLKSLNQDLRGIDGMPDIEMPAQSTVVRFVGDMEEAPEVTAVAVFVDKKPELLFQQKVEQRSSVEIDFKGGDASVYSGITPQFIVKF